MMERFSSQQLPQGDVGQTDDLIRIPVFVFPSSLIFNSQDRDHLKQILTIYNPYDFPIRFKVLSTHPAHYTVTNPEGSIKPKNCTDLIVRLTSSVPYESSTTPLLEDKFRIQIYHYYTKKALGKKDIPSVIHFGSSPSLFQSKYESNSPFSSIHSQVQQEQGFSESFQQLSGGSGGGSGGSVQFAAASTYAYGPFKGETLLALVIAMFCILGLMLPSAGDNNNSCTPQQQNDQQGNQQSSSYSLIPSYLHLSVNQKLLISYTLGLVTLIIFRP